MALVEVGNKMQNGQIEVTQPDELMQANLQLSSVLRALKRVGSLALQKSLLYILKILTFTSALHICWIILPQGVIFGKSPVVVKFLLLSKSFLKLKIAGDDMVSWCR